MNNNSSNSNRQPDIVNRRTVLAIASAGGHWIQLRRLHPSFNGTRIIYATTRESYREEVEASGAEFRVVPDCNRWQKFKLLKSALSIAWLILKLRPDAIVTTGAAPGYFAIRIGRLLGASTIWVDSIANADELSLSGQKAGKHVNHWITQWAHLATPKGPHFFGNVLGCDTDTGVDPSIMDNSTPNIQRPPDSTSDSKPINIFVTVGTDLPFDRLIKAVDDWAAKEKQPNVEAQIGKSNFKPKHISYENFLEPPQFKKCFLNADLIISHAGMGTILSSLLYQKTLLVMPRIAALGEHRNEHQLATAKYLKQLNRINVAADENELVAKLSKLSEIEVREPIGPYAAKKLTETLKRFIVE